MLNKIIIQGRLTKDVELRYTPSGTAVANFTLANDTGYGDKKETTFVNITIWNKLAENCAKYLGKGKMCLVEGRLNIRNYEGNDGAKRYITEIIANGVEFLSPAEHKEQEEFDTSKAFGGEGFTSVPDFDDTEDLPF